MPCRYKNSGTSEASEAMNGAVKTLWTSLVFHALVQFLQCLQYTANADAAGPSNERKVSDDIGRLFFWTNSCSNDIENA